MRWSGEPGLSRARFKAKEWALSLRERGLTALVNVGRQSARISRGGVDPEKLRPLASATGGTRGGFHRRLGRDYDAAYR